MGFVSDAVDGIGGVLGSFTGATQAAEGAQQAAQTQAQSAQAGIDEQRRQFDAIRQLLAPFVGVGTNALSQQGNLIGLNGADAQSGAIQALQASPQFQALTQQGENAILQNASATGGLRGGNVQAALGQFRPALLSQLMEQQYGRLGDLTSLGQNSAVGVGNAGLNAGRTIADLLGQQGSAIAGGQLARAGRTGQVFGDLAQIGGALFTGGAFSDRRLKHSVSAIGQLPNGLRLYAWQYLWGEPGLGVMADEASAVVPAAVMAGPGGYQMVDYSQI